MNYFQVLGIVFGLAAFLKPFYMHVIPWDENKFIARAYTKERPHWIIPVAILGLVLIGFTLYKEFTTDIRFSWIISLMFSLTAIKAIFFIFDYHRFQKWVSGMLAKERGKKIVVIDILASAFGILMIAVSYFIN